MFDTEARAIVPEEGEVVASRSAECDVERRRPAAWRKKCSRCGNDGAALVDGDAAPVDAPAGVDRQQGRRAVRAQIA